MNEIKIEFHISDIQCFQIDTHTFYFFLTDSKIDEFSFNKFTNALVDEFENRFEFSFLFFVINQQNYNFLGSKIDLSSLIEIKNSNKKSTSIQTNNNNSTTIQKFPFQPYESPNLKSENTIPPNLLNSLEVVVNKMGFEILTQFRFETTLEDFDLNNLITTNSKNREYQKAGF